MTITLSPEVERAVTEESVRRGTTPDELVEEAVRERYALPQETPEERRSRIHALVGSMAYLGPSRLLEDRAEERAREERQLQK